MTPLADELLRVLQSGEMLQAASFPKILHAVGFGVDRVSVGAVESAMTELINAGLCERQFRRGRCYYAALPGQSIETARHVGPG